MSTEFYQEELTKAKGYTVVEYAETPEKFPVIIVERDGDRLAIIISRDPEFNGPGHFEVSSFDDADG